MAAERALKKLGAEIAVARRRRRITQKRLAEGANLAVPTIRRLEAGDPGISIGNLAMVLVVLGELDRLSGLLDLGDDDVGLLLDAQNLPKRVRPARSSTPRPANKQPGPQTNSNNEIDDEAF